jgi:hypothetical protein
MSNLLMLGCGGARGGGGGGGSFVPTDLGTGTLGGWWDFSDTGTITDAGAGAVSQVTDKSGNGNTMAQGTGANRPVTGTQTLNTFNVLVFDGTNDRLEQTASFTNIPNIPLTLIVLRKFSSGTTGGVMRGHINSSNGCYVNLGRTSNVMAAHGDRFNDGTATAASYADSDNTNWHINTGIYASNTRTIFEDGTSKNTSATTVTLTNPIERLTIGESVNLPRNAFTYLNGMIAEAYILTGTTQLNYQKCEGYLAHKYGITLDAGHPYFAAPP